MAQKDKSAYYKQLKAAGVELTKHYREYTTDELQALWTELPDNQRQPIELEETGPVFDAAEAFLVQEPELSRVSAPPAPTSNAPAEGELPGMRQNTKLPDDVIRIDENGLSWLQEEVRKPSSPQPRGRRVLSYEDQGSKMQHAQVGEYTESFEVSGDRRGRRAEVKITLPSYQVGIYRDPNFPFKVHTYNGARAFDLEEVEEFYGGPDLVPTEIKRVYVDSVLCYDMRTTIRTIQAEARELELRAGRNF